MRGFSLPPGELGSDIAELLDGKNKENVENPLIVYICMVRNEQCTDSYIFLGYEMNSACTDPFDDIFGCQSVLKGQTGFF